MRAGANAPLHRRQQDTALSQRGNELVAGHPGIGRIEEHQIGLRLLHLHAGDLRQAACQRSRVGVIVGQSRDVMIQRVDAGRRADAGLAHRAAEALFPAPDLIDEVARSGQHRANWRPQSLAEIDPHRVPSGRHVACADAGGDAGIEQACAVHMRDQAVRLRQFGDTIQDVLLPDRAAADVGGLLDADEGLRWLITCRWMQRRAKRLERELSVVAGQLRDLETAKRRMRAAFARDDVRRRLREDFIAGTAMRQRRCDVAHGARGHEYRSLLAEQRGDAFAQQIDGGIVADLFVADFGTRHRLAHRGCRARLRVGQ